MDTAVPAIRADRFWQNKCGGHEDFSINPLSWEFTGLKGMQQLQALKETALVYDKAPIQNTAGDYSFFTCGMAPLNLLV